MALTLALFFGNRGFFPGELIESAREELRSVVEAAGHRTLMMDAALSRYGAVETVEEGRAYARFLEAHKSEVDGVILSLPNFGDENGAVAALRDCGVPILIQAYPDEIGKMDPAQRRDAFCGKFSIMDVFYQCDIPFTAMKPHVCHPASKAFGEQLEQFAATCRVVKQMRRCTIGAIGARTTAFKTVRFDELALQRYGITIETYDLTELFERARKVDRGGKAFADKKLRLSTFADFSRTPAQNLETLCTLGVAIDDMIAQYGLDAIALRCWEEIPNQLNVSPCVLLGEMNDRGIVAACELDVGNALTMRALAAASGKAATCLDWNNNYGDDEDKCILFHCGPVPASMMAGKGEIISHVMFDRGLGAGSSWGCNSGRIAAMPFTFASAKTEDGAIQCYIGEGEFTDDPIEDTFFGCGGVARVSGLQDALLAIGKNGFRHHVSASSGKYAQAVKEAMSNYLGYEIIELD